MRKIVTAFSIVASFVFMGMTVTQAEAATDWDVSGNYVINFEYLGGFYAHDLILTQDGSDMLTGSGGHPAGGPHVYTWIITSGSVVNDTVTFTANYTASPDAVVPQTTMIVSGAIASNGTMSGTWTDNYQGGTRGGAWTTTSGNADNDSDNDGVPNADDVCSGTVADGAWTEGIGQNRWQVKNIGGILSWYQHKVRKGVHSDTVGEGIAYTYGCNGHQIIELLEGVMNGHLKHGISSGLLEEFHLDLSDGVLDGRYLVETVIVPANDADGVSGTVALLAGQSYVLKASGTAYACNETGCVIQFDADYSTSDASTWVDGVAFPYNGDANLLDLKVNGGFVDWDTDTTYNNDHTYEYATVGAGAPVSLMIYDLYAPNNTGALTVHIYAQI